MIKKINIITIFLAIIVLTLVNISNGDICNNNVIKCYFYSSGTVDCTIYQIHTDMISQAISNCSTGNFTKLFINFKKELHFNTVTVTLNFSSNIQRLSIGNTYWRFGIGSKNGHSPIQTVKLVSVGSHPCVSFIHLGFLEYLSIHNPNNFFENFPNVTGMKIESSYFDAVPNFTLLEKLTNLYISYSNLTNSENATINRDFIGGLSNLRKLSFLKCGIQNITTDAFSNLNSLTSLYLGYNNILELAPNVFESLGELKSLNFDGNKYDIRIFKGANNKNAFSPLIKLIGLSIYPTIVPFDAFTTLSSIQNLRMPQSSSVTVPSTLFKHLHNLKHLYFYGTPLVCDCNMQWASIVGKFGINVNGWCDDRCCNNNVRDASLYTECELTESYQCFNKSVSCNYSCINTPDSYICTACDAGFGLTQTETESTCNDIDECLANKSQCEQKCRNTLGSYQCYCDSGYRLLDDLISCTDIDECSKYSLNTCEQHQCMNEVGSYTCICDPGYQLTGDGYSCSSARRNLAAYSLINITICLVIFLVSSCLLV